MDSKEYWNMVANEKKFSTPFQMDLYKKYVSNDKKILDIGCGYGRILKELYDNGYTDLLGIDFSSEMIKLATIPSHNSKEAIESATLVARIIYYFRNGYTKEEVYKILNIDIKYIPFTKFNTTCEETIDNCLYILYNSNSFEDAIYKALLMGGDTDTNATIVGSMAEALYGIDDSLIEKVNNKIPDNFVKVLSKVR